jgi:superfamily I DNA and/or RNA helicase
LFFFIFQTNYFGLINQDGFQGREKDIIIFSCVRVGEDKGIGFLKDIRRMNVALTRAKCSLFILGNRAALESNSQWKELIKDAIQRGFYTDVSIKPIFFFGQTFLILTHLFGYTSFFISVLI